MRQNTVARTRVLGGLCEACGISADTGVVENVSAQASVDALQNWTCFYPHALKNGRVPEFVRETSVCMSIAGFRADASKRPSSLETGLGRTPEWPCVRRTVCVDLKWGDATSVGFAYAQEYDAAWKLGVFVT